MGETSKVLKTLQNYCHILNSLSSFAKLSCVSFFKREKMIIFQFKQTIVRKKNPYEIIYVGKKLNVVVCYEKDSFR